MPRFVIALVVGVLLGATGPRYAFLGWFSLIPWGLVGLALGYWSKRREAALTGALYGFVLCFAFLMTGYTGSAPIISRLPFFALIGMFGALCGLLLSLVGFFLKRRFEGLTTKQP